MSEMNYDLNVPGMDKILCDDLVKIANHNSLTDNPPKHSWRISPSSLGMECAAAIWFRFRWAKPASYEGHIARLFNDGHKTENEFVAALRRMGWLVWDTDPNRATSRNPQYRVKDFGGHLSGYLDGIGQHHIFTRGANVLLEFKTANDKKFKLFAAKSIREVEPKYYTQACVYMFYYDLPWCLFFIKNKNTSEYLFKIVARDDAHAREKLRLAEATINSEARPAKIAQNPAHHKCKFCEYINVCHYNEPADKSCRACMNCVAIDGGNFACKIRGPIPGEAEIKAGCDMFQSI